MCRNIYCGNVNFFELFSVESSMMLSQEFTTTLLTSNQRQNCLVLYELCLIINEELKRNCFKFVWK